MYFFVHVIKYYFQARRCFGSVGSIRHLEWSSLSIWK